MIKSIIKLNLWFAMLSPLCVSAQTSYVDDFSAPTGWSGGSFTLTPENGTVKVTGRRLSAWDAFSKTFTPINISTSPYVNLRIRAKKDFMISIALGTGETSEGIIAYPVKPVRSNPYIGTESEVVASDDFHDYSFNFSGATYGDPAVPLDLTKVTWINILVNPLSPFDNTGLNEEFYIDDLRIGTSARVLPTVSNVLNQGFIVRETGSAARIVNLRNITDGADLTNPVSISATSSNTTLVSNANLIVNYSSPSRRGTLSIKPNDNVVGESIITVKLSAANASDKLMTFKVTVRPNAAPVMETIASTPLKKGVGTRVPLIRVTDGDIDASQVVTLTSTSSNPNVIPNPVVSFDPITGTGYLTVTPVASATNGSTATISVVLTDDAGTILGGVNTKTYTFVATAFAEVNKAPLFDVIPNQTRQNISEVQSITLTSISNGDNGDRNLSFSAINSNPSVVSNITFSAINKGSAVMSFSTVGVGTSTITVTLQDAQGNAGNNGNLNFVRTFTITSIPPSNNAFLENFNSTTLPLGLFPPAEHILTMDNGALKVTADFPAQSYPGTIIDLTLLSGRTIDISKSPFIKVRMKSASTNNNGIIPSDPNSKLTKFFISLWDQDDDAGYQNATAEANVPADNQWHEFVLDYRGKFFNNANGQVDSTKIKQLLINFDTRWFQAVKGQYWIDFIQMGEGLSVSSVGAAKGSSIANQTVLKGQTPKPVVLSGINDGLGGDKVSMRVLNNKPSLVSNVSISTVVGGSATLTYTLAPTTLKVDSAKISVITSNPEQPGFKVDTVNFYVFSVDTSGTAPAIVNINKTQTFQTIDGLGMAVYNRTTPIDIIASTSKEMNFNIFRIFGDFDGSEEVNDNNDPNVLALENFNFNMKVMSNIKTLHEATDAKFFYTILTAPFWLKYNKAKHAFLGPHSFAVNNRYRGDMLDEYAEFCVAIVRGFKAYAGIDLYGISLQNEPEAMVPYESTLVSPAEYMEMIKTVGRRFRSEGINTTIMMPEDVTGNPDWYLSHMRTLEQDQEARSYVGLGAIHIYDRAGINPAEGASVVWDPFVQATKRAVPSGVLWMTETSGYSFNVWEGEWYEAYSERTFAPGPLEYGATLYRGFKFGQVSGWTDLGGYENNQGSLIYGIYKSYSKYMEPGTKMVSATSSDNNILSLAFTHPDNTLTSILINSSKLPIKVKITGAPGAYQMHTTMKGASFNDMGVVNNESILLPASSLSVFHSASGNIKPTIDVLANTVIGMNEGTKIVNITGITDGELQKSQTLAVTSSSSDPTVATVSVSYTSPNSNGNLVITPLKVGTTKVRVLVKDNGGVANNASDSAFVEFTVNVQLVNGVEEAQRGTIAVFPNPANKQISVVVSSQNVTELNISDLSGRILIQQAVSSNESPVVDVSQLSEGTYIITAKGSKTVLVNKFYKQ